MDVGLLRFIDASGCRFFVIDFSQMLYASMWCLSISGIYLPRLITLRVVTNSGADVVPRLFEARRHSQVLWREINDNRDWQRRKVWRAIVPAIFS